MRSSLQTGVVCLTKPVGRRVNGCGIYDKNNKMCAFIRSNFGLKSCIIPVYLCCTALFMLTVKTVFCKRGTVVQGIDSRVVVREPLPFLRLIYADSKILVTAAGRIVRSSFRQLYLFWEK